MLKTNFMKFIVQIWIILFISCVNIVDTILNEVPEYSDCNLFGHKSNHLSDQLELVFETQILKNEYIVQFKQYYKFSTRYKFLKASLQNTNISNWIIVPRLNPAELYPSDFEIIRFINGDITSENRIALESHPTIKRISPHRSIQRQLSYTSYNESQNTAQKPLISEKSNNGRHLFRAIPRQITTSMQANVLWKFGITGKGVKVAVFDTGLARNHPHFRRVKERTNWTNEKSLDDGVSHGTFVAGVIASSSECLGFAPDAELHIYRVFTNNQVSYTSWFLDAFNYAIFRKINVLNLSIGGPDFLDYPFVDKVLELSANRVIMISAIGNDGPLYGTLNNPGDQSDVIGVGGINFDHKVAKFSSRGMTTWELPYGYGRLKPDIVTFGSQVKGSNIRSGCRSLSGTSVASPVVAGAITLIISGALHKMPLINPSSIKQVLMEGALRLNDNNMFEQGHGKLNIVKSMKLLSAYMPKVTLSPQYLDFSESYMWPYNSQPLFCDSMPIIVNVTILNGISVTGKIVSKPSWHADIDRYGNLLDVGILYSPILWPWSGWMGVHLAVMKSGCDFEGSARGYISLIIENPSSDDEGTPINTTVYFPINVQIIPRPPRHKRILWDQYHSLRYPPGYIPRDNLKVKADPLDWRADHIHTNFKDMYSHLRSAGYYVDVLRTDYSCFNASYYGTLLIVDPEDEFFDEEIIKLQNDVYEVGLSVIVFADWYNTTVMKKIKFFDENTRQWWIPDTGGSNIPALNDLLKPYGIAFDDFVAEGFYRLGDHSMYYASGSTIAVFPENSENIVIGTELNDQGAEILGLSNQEVKERRFVPILGLLQTKQTLRKKYALEKHITSFHYEQTLNDNIIVDNDNLKHRNPILNKRILLNVMPQRNIKFPNIPTEKLRQPHKSKLRDWKNHFTEGRIAVFGDSNCLDSANMVKACFWLLDALLEFTMNSHKSSLLINLNKTLDFKLRGKSLPIRLANSNLYKFSKVLDPVNKYKKKSIGQCESLKNVKVVPVNDSDVKSMLSNLKRDSDVSFFDSQNPNSLGFLVKLSESLGDQATQMTIHPQLSEIDSLDALFIFVIVLPCIVLTLFINWFRRKKLTRY